MIDVLILITSPKSFSECILPYHLISLNMCILELDELLLKLCHVCREYQMKLKRSQLNLRKSHMIVLKVNNQIQCILQLPVCHLLTQKVILKKTKMTLTTRMLQQRKVQKVKAILMETQRRLPTIKSGMHTYLNVPM